MSKIKEAMLGWAYEVAEDLMVDYGLEPTYFDTGYGEWRELREWVEQYVQTAIDATGRHPIDLGYSIEDAAEEIDIWMMGRVTDDDSGPCGLRDYDGREYWESEYPGGALSESPIV